MKKNIHLLLIIFLSLLISGTLEAQNRKGLILDDADYEAIPKKANLLTRDFVGMPKAISLKKYCPTPGHQGQYGTCVAWSSSYAARTIIEAIQHNWTDAEMIRKEAFAPGYTYFYTKDDSDIGCTEGTRLNEALTLHKTKGVPKFNVLTETCLSAVPDNRIIASAEKNKIKDFVRLFGTKRRCTSQNSICKKGIGREAPCFDWYERNGIFF